MDALYENDLKPLATEWVTCSTVRKDLNAKSQEVFVPLKDQRGIYYFTISLGPVDKKRRYLYDFYKVVGSMDGGGGGGENWSRRNLSPKHKLLPEESSGLYLAEAMRTLNTYTEKLTIESLEDLERRLSVIGQERFYKEMVPLFFYRNLVRYNKSRSILIVRPGQSFSTVTTTTTIPIMIRPVYGSSHNPLKLSILHKESTRVQRNELVISFVGYQGIAEITQKDIRDEKTVPKKLQIPLENESDLWDGLQYVILSIVNTLDQAQLSLEKSQQTSKENHTLRIWRLLKNKFQNITTEKNTREIGQFFGNRLEVLDKEILYAVKLVQLYQKQLSPGANREENAEKAKVMIEEIRGKYNAVGGGREEIEKTLVRMIDDYHKIFPPV